MLDCGSMAVFAFDNGVRSLLNAFVLVAVAVLAILFTLILDLEILPVLDIAFPEPPIHIPPFVNAEIFGHIK
jgi:hypothetical protein